MPSFIFYLGGSLTDEGSKRRPHVVWKEKHRQTYLDEMMRWEGRGDFRGTASCPECVLRKKESQGAPVYRCLECFMPDLVCQACCVSRHRVNPFHRVEVTVTPLSPFQ